MTNEITIVLADTSTLRRKAVADRFAKSIGIHECDTISGLLRFVLSDKPNVVVLGSLDGDPFKIIEAAHQIRNISSGTKVILIADCSTEAIAIGPCELAFLNISRLRSTHWNWLKP